MTATKQEAAPAKTWRLEEWFPELDKSTHELLKNYESLLQKYSKAVSLVSAKTLMFTDIIHFADCILASKIIFESNSKINHIIDVGSGNGFPGAIIAALHKNVEVTCLESDDRKIEFLNALAAELKLSNFKVFKKGIESLEPGSVTCAIYRGGNNISKSILSARKAFKVGGIYYHMKSEQWGMEISEIPTQLCSVWSPSLVKEYKLPVGNFKFAVVKTEKIS